MLCNINTFVETKFVNNLIHAFLLVASIYASQHPDLAPYGPAIQALGQGILPPK